MLVHSTKATGFATSVRWSVKLVVTPRDERHYIVQHEVKLMPLSFVDYKSILAYLQPTLSLI